MQPLLIGRFALYDQAQATADRLVEAGFKSGDISVFYLSPPGQHNTHPIGGDEDESHGTHHASAGAVKGAMGGVGAGTLIGAATLPILGPAGPLLGAAAGAYAGSVVGALKSMSKSDEAVEEAADKRMDPADVEAEAEVGVAEPEQQSSVILAVTAPGDEDQRTALAILGEFADHIESAEGDIRNGKWIDVDPASLHRKEGVTPAPAQRRAR